MNNTDKSYTIYQIKNNVTGKSYIGQTCNLPARIKGHKSLLRNNKHRNFNLQEDYNKYGEGAFDVIPIITNIETREDADIMEEALITVYYDDIYNISKNSRGGDTISYHPKHDILVENNRKIQKEYYDTHPEIKEKIGRINSGENNFMYGKHLSKEQSEIISKANKNRVWSDASKQKISESLIDINNKNREIGRPRDNKPVSCDGKIYESIADASRSLNIPHSVISSRCNSIGFEDWYYI